MFFKGTIIFHHDLLEAVITTQDFNRVTPDTWNLSKHHSTNNMQLITYTCVCFL